ncbi:TraB/GumN family protein [Duganella sp. FT80W]|uniref:TraB/GumN family protein n=1 Tax=Duganella guangzhouensis TaxID=2666084 RepID=A0A6I2KWG2_9BURK|nr:TraB/GumN family protein [Duganella guangzhouensis]
MRRQIIVLFCSLFLFVFGSGHAAEQGAAPNRGALFKVQQGGHTLYLFGTIHVGSKAFYPLEPRIGGLLKSAPVLALEIDPLGDPQKLSRAVQQHGISAKGASALSPAWRQRLDRLLRQYNIEPETVATMKPWLLASLLTVSEFAAQGYDASLAVDAHLAKQAHDAGRKVVELESADSQMALFDKMTPAEQLTFLQEAIASIEDKEQADQAREIAEAWRNADSSALEALALKAEQDDSFSGRFVQKVLLEGRNPALADSMLKLMARENNSVAAIGILHLVGQYSVPEQLRKRGASVERIY